MLSVLSKDVISYILKSFVHPRTLLLIPLVSKQFREIALDDNVWRHKCSAYGYRDTQKSEKNGYLKWFWQVKQTKFNTKVNNSYFEFNKGSLKIRKISNSPDASIAILKRKITSGIAYCEFSIKVKNDEMWIGVTTDKDETATITGWSIINNKKTWAYNDRRTGLEYGEIPGIPAPKYSQGDRIGVFVDKDKGVVEFFNNGTPVGSSESAIIPAEKPVWFFVMTDALNDTVEIVERY